MRILLALLLLVATVQAKTRTVQQEAELKDWIIGIQSAAQEAQKEADEAERSAKESRDQSAVANQRLDVVQGKYDAEREAKIEEARLKEKAQAQAAAEKKRADLEHSHVARIKTWLSIALAVVFVLGVQYVPFSIMPPPMSIYLRVGASVAAAAFAWVLVAQFV